jgi:hypothetical protein
MKTIFSSRRHLYMARVSIFLTVLALIVGMVGCGGGAIKYNLTTAVTPGAACGNATDLTNASPYVAGTKVSIKAVANPGYWFINWTAPAGTFANANAPQTTFTMPAQDVTVTANFEASEFHGGSGTAGDPYQIADWHQLYNVRNYRDSYFILVNNLNSTTAGYTERASPTANGGKGWQPIGSIDRDTLQPIDPFTGTFEGQGYEIRDLFIDRPGEDGVGLFGSVDEGVIEDVGVVKATVNGRDWVGGLVGWDFGTVGNSYSTGSVTGNSSVGGLVGFNFFTVSDSYASGSVTGNYTVGGLVALNEGTVSNSYYNYDEVLINDKNIITIGALFSEDFDQWLNNDKFLNVNGRLSQEDGYYVINNVSDFKQLLVFGQNDTLKFRLKNDLDLATEPNFYIPYLAGEFDGNGHKISNLSFNHNFVSAVGLFGDLVAGGIVTDVGVENVNITGCAYVGGLVGFLVGWPYGGTVSNSYATGSVTVMGESGTCIGGLVGVIWFGTVSNSYSTGNVSGNTYVGGLVGASVYSTVGNSYSTGSVTGNSSVGGLVGYNIEHGTVSNSFWDTETSGQSTSAGGIGKTTAEMQDIGTFTDWDMIAVANPSTRNPSYIWNIVNDETYPFLSWQPTG